MTVAEDFMEDIEGEEGETPELDDQGVLVDQVDPVTSSSVGGLYSASKSADPIRLRQTDRACPDP